MTKKLWFLIFIFGLIGASFWMWRCRGLKNESLVWPSATGLVVDGEMENAMRRTWRIPDTVLARVQLQFVVNGQKFVSWFPIPQQSVFGSWESAEKALNAFPRGRELQVFYNPANPKQSTLIKGDVSCNLWPLVLGFIFVFLGLFKFLTVAT